MRSQVYDKEEVDRILENKILIEYTLDYINEKGFGIEALWVINSVRAYKGLLLPFELLGRDRKNKM